MRTVGFLSAAELSVTATFSGHTSSWRESQVRTATDGYFCSPTIFRTTQNTTTAWT
jgi:hypothetical protein